MSKYIWRDVLSVSFCYEKIMQNYVGAGKEVMIGPRFLRQQSRKQMTFAPLMEISLYNTDTTNLSRFKLLDSG